MGKVVEKIRVERLNIEERTLCSCCEYWAGVEGVSAEGLQKGAAEYLKLAHGFVEGNDDNSAVLVVEGMMGMAIELEVRRGMEEDGLMGERMSFYRDGLSVVVVDKIEYTRWTNRLKQEGIRIETCQK